MRARTGAAKPAPRAAVVIPAGGTGARMRGGGGGAGGGEAGGAGESHRVWKQFLLLAGEPLLLRSLRPFLGHPAVEWVVVVLPAAEALAPPGYLGPEVTVVAGGATRGASVRAGLDAVPAAADVVLIHDAARPLVTAAVIDRVLEGATRDAGAIAAVPVADTLKRVSAEDEITETVDRTRLWRAQTPQGFPRARIVDAYRRAAAEGWTGTDDAAVVERYGGRVRVVEGDPRNLKITHPEDLALAELILASIAR